MSSGEDKEAPAKSKPKPKAKAKAKAKPKPKAKAKPKALTRTKGSIAKHDPLQAYINEVRRYDLLKPEEEYELAVKYTETGDVDAARRLVTANLRLVVKIAHEYR